MTEITRVPILPMGKGIITKFWIAVVVAILLAAGAAYAARYQGVTVDTLAEGEGPSPASDDVALINYEGRLKDGTVFDSAEGAVLPLAAVVPGFAEALTQMQRGGRYEVMIPSDQAYGDEAAGDIPPGSDLYFTVEMIEFRSQAEIQAMQEQLRAMGLGGQGAPPPPPAE